MREHDLIYMLRIRKEKKEKKKNLERQRRAAEAAAVVEYALYCTSRRGEQRSGSACCGNARRWMDAGRAESVPIEIERGGRSGTEGGRRWEQDGIQTNLEKENPSRLQACLGSVRFGAREDETANGVFLAFRSLVGLFEPS